jgi:hypothetical protein
MRVFGLTSLVQETVYIGCGTFRGRLYRKIGGASIEFIGELWLGRSLALSS